MVVILGEKMTTVIEVNDGVPWGPSNAVLLDPEGAIYLSYDLYHFLYGIN